MLKVVSNTSPIIALSSIGKIGLLHKFYNHIILPEKVYQEILSGLRDSPGIKEIKSLNWFEIHKIKNSRACEYLSLELDEGEAQTIILAEEIGNSLTIIDDFTAREIAKIRGLKVIGTLGILLKAKKIGLIEKVKPLINELINNGFWIDKNLYNLILKISKEK